MAAAREPELGVAWEVRVARAARSEAADLRLQVLVKDGGVSNIQTRFLKFCVLGTVHNS